MGFKMDSVEKAGEMQNISRRRMLGLTAATGLALASAGIRHSDTVKSGTSHAQLVDRPSHHRRYGHRIIGVGGPLLVFHLAKMSGLQAIQCTRANREG